MDRAMVFGKYCLLERISVGGMAEVFRAKPLPAEEAGNKMLALKRILPHLAEDDEFITMFVDEAKLTVQLDHPNIVQTYELGNFQSSYYILMEYIAGADVLALQKYLRQNRRIMSVAQACYIAEKVARGLHHAHTACDEQGRPFNIIHRDVSPQNIRLTFDGRVKLIDFGIAKAAVQRTKTEVGVLKGKFGYMSPEQVHDQGMDHRADVFALGTTLWEMLTNRRLFNGENEYETLQLVKNLDVDPPSKKNSHVPPEVDGIVMRALTEKPDGRFQTAAALADALEDFRTGIDQPYTGEHLADWMAETFSDELADEQRKRRLYAQIEQPEDVKWFNGRYVDDEPAGDEPQPAEETSPPPSTAAEETGPEPETGDTLEETAPTHDIWDPDFAPDEGTEVDHEQFASEHTVVAAGGFDPSEFEDESDEIIALDEEEIVELDAEELTEVDQEAMAGGQPSGSGRESVGEGRSGGGEIPETQPGAQTPPGGPEERERDPANWADAPTEHTDDSPADRTDTRPEARIDDDSESGAGLRIASAAAALLALVSMTAVVAYQAIGDAEGEPSARASMVVTVEPTPESGGEIAIDGEVRGGEVPVTLPDIEAGTHVVEAEFPGFRDVRRKVELKPGDLRTLTLELERTSEALASLRLEVDASDEVEVFVDGERVEWRPEGDGIEVEPGRHLVEVRAPGRALWSRVVHPGPGETLTEHVELAEAGVSLRVETSEPAQVELDGEEIGEAPQTLEGLSPRNLHRLVVEATSSEARYETHLGLPRIGRSGLRIDFDDPPPSREADEFGRLAATTGEDWWQVLIDGVQTGVTTPLSGDDALPVSAGTHAVTLRRGNEMHDFSVEIEEGERRVLNETLSFDWNARAER